MSDDWLGLILVFSLVDNVILSRLLGISPRAGGAGNARAALWPGVWTAVLMGTSALAGWAIDALVLEPLGLGFLRTPAFVLAVAGLTCFSRSSRGPHIASARALFRLLPAGSGNQLRYPRSRASHDAGGLHGRGESRRRLRGRCGLHARTRAHGSHQRAAGNRTDPPGTAGIPA